MCFPRARPFSLSPITSKRLLHRLVKCIQVNFSEVDSSCCFVQVRGAFITSLIESATVDTTQVTMSRVGLFSQASFQVSYFCLLSIYFLFVTVQWNLNLSNHRGKSKSVKLYIGSF